MKLSRLLGLPAFLVAFPGASLNGQVVTGTVREDSTGRPLAGADVAITALGRRTVTNERGQYVLDGLQPGLRLLQVRAIGYHPMGVMVRLKVSDTTQRDVSLVPAPVQLDPVVVSGRPSAPRGLGVEAFQERRKLGFGRFIDSAELRRSEHLRPTDVLRRHQVSIVRWQERCDGKPCGPVHLRAASTRRASSSGIPCWMQVVLDGVVLYRSVQPGQEASIPPPDFSRDFTVSSLEAIEVYGSAAATPVEFGGSGAACGTVVLWTRRE